jgi:hypothetical protein
VLIRVSLTRPVVSARPKPGHAPPKSAVLHSGERCPLTDLEEVIAAVLGCAVDVTWTIDLADGPAALVFALLLGRGQRVLYLPGVAVNRAADAYRGEGKTDAKDAAVVADQGRMRRDLRELELDDQVIAELRMLTAHRADLAADRTPPGNILPRERVRR